MAIKRDGNEVRIDVMLSTALVGKAPKRFGWKKFARGFKLHEVTPRQLADHIQRGYSFVPPFSNGDRVEKNFMGSYHVGFDFDNISGQHTSQQANKAAAIAETKASINYNQPTGHFAVTSAKEYRGGWRINWEYGSHSSGLEYLMRVGGYAHGRACFAYSTASSTPEQPKSRVVFVTPHVIPTVARHRAVYEAIAHEFAIDGSVTDSACKDALRLYYGSLDCTVVGEWHVMGVGVVDSLIDKHEKRNQALVVSAPAAPPAVTVTAGTGDVSGRIKYELDKVATAPAGQRFTQLQKSAYLMGGWVATGYIDEVAAQKQLETAIAAAGGDTPLKDANTIAKCMTAGKSQPATIEDKRMSTHTTNTHTQAPPPPPPAAPPDLAGELFPQGVAPAAAPQAIATPQVTSGADLFVQEFEPFVWIVDELFAFGQLFMLAGRPKSGKSWFVLQMIAHIDAGKPFLGKDTQGGRILYIALEDGARRVHQRLQILKWKPSANADFAFDILPFAGGDGLGAGIEQIAELARDYDIIVIDTLIATLKGGANENDNVQMGNVVQSLANIAQATNTGIMLVHHSGKGKREDPFDALRGASSIRGAYHVGAMLTRSVDEQEAILDIESKDFDVESLTIQHEPTGSGWVVLGNKSVMANIKSNRAIESYMADYGDGFTAADYAQAMDVTVQNAYGVLGTAVKRRELRMVEEKPDGGGRAVKTYYDANTLPPMPEPPPAAAHASSPTQATIGGLGDARKGVHYDID